MKNSTTRTTALLEHVFVKVFKISKTSARKFASTFRIVKTQVNPHELYRKAHLGGLFLF